MFKFSEVTLTILPLPPQRASTTNQPGGYRILSFVVLLFGYCFLFQKLIVIICFNIDFLWPYAISISLYCLMAELALARSIIS